MAEEFVDYYELLEVSPNANSSTIERVFRYLAKKYHPDVAGGENRAMFQQLVEGFETLRDPESRARYDTAYQRQQQANVEVIEGANAAGEDCAERYNVLSILYGQRRRDYKKPGIGLGTLETLVSFPPEVLHFHIWYFKEKGWVSREESGQLSITAAGVDQVDSMNQPSEVTDFPRLESQSDALNENQLTTV